MTVPGNDDTIKSQDILRPGDAMNEFIFDDRSMAMGFRKPVSHVLTEKEISSIIADAKAIMVPVDVLCFNVGLHTGFVDDLETINIRGDILPDLDSTVARDRMSQRAVLAHEYYGHYKNHPSEYDIGDWRDEFRASYDAAVHTPNLTEEERALLMIDAYDRAKEAGIILEYDETARRVIYGY